MADPSFLLNYYPVYHIFVSFAIFTYDMHYTFFSFAKDGKHSFDTIIVKLYFYLKISAAISNFQHRSLSEFDMGYPVTHRII